VPPSGLNLKVKALPEKAELHPDIVNARPTKEFFISMLTKDIELSRSIIDLVDNALDGARRLRKNQDYDGLVVKIEATRQHFKVEDNCGGIDIDLAREVAFRFPSDCGDFGFPRSG
jgi:hypothetical protein